MPKLAAHVVGRCARTKSGVDRQQQVSEYFADVLPRLGGTLTREELVELMPARWKARRAAAQ